MKVIKIIIAITGVMIMVMAHDLGHEIYTSYFRPSSHGVGLGFIRFYMLFVLLPVVYLTPFIANKYTHTLSCIAILYLLFSWGRFASIASYFNDFIIHAIVYVGVIFKEN